MNDRLRDWLLFIICWIFTIVFLIIFFTHTGFTPLSPVNRSDWYFLLLALGFSLLPFFSKIKIGKLIELERDIKKTKEEFTDYHIVSNQMIQTLSNSVNAVASLHNTININVPGNRELLQDKEVVKGTIEIQAGSPEESIREDLLRGEVDLNDALTRARRRLEALLREILGKKSKFIDSDQKIKYMGLYKLFDTFVNEYPKYRNLRVALADINNVLNAAIHAQRIPESQAETTLDIASDLIAALEYINQQRNSS